MEDLSHWEFAYDFSAEEAAALIAGLDLHAIGGSLFSTSGANPKGVTAIPIYQRMNAEYKHLRGWYHNTLNPQDDRDDYEGPRKPNMLSCLHMEWREKRWNQLAQDEVSDFYHWLESDSRSGFETQRFSRSEIARWISDIGVKSIYQFDKSKTTASQVTTARWPWGEYETTLLGHLEAAALRYWVKYDPDDAMTAQTNATVAEWLVEHRNVSKKMAEAIASILRPDGLPTGPRK